MKIKKIEQSFKSHFTLSVFLIFLFLLLSKLTLSIETYNTKSNLEYLKEFYKYRFIEGKPKNAPNIVSMGDRLEADALLELATEKYLVYTDYQNYTTNFLSSDEVLLIMPRIDLLEKYMDALSKTTKNMYIFIMDEDKLDDNVYGDRSYETYLAKGLDKKLPANTKVFRLKNESVTSSGVKNNFELSDIKTSKVFKRQIEPIYLKNSALVKAGY